MTVRHPMRSNNESGIAMVTTLLVLMLMSALLVGFTTVVMSDQRYRFIDRDRGAAFYAASAGVEKLTADLGNLFLSYVAPTTAQVTALTTTAPAISGITFTAPQAPAALPASQLTAYHCGVAGTKTVALVGTNGYTITYCRSNATLNPAVSDDSLIIGGTGAYSGMTALQTPYQIDVTAKTATGGEVHLVRTIQAVAIPVFQFGIFSDSDLSYFAREAFGFGGRVHTNGNLWLAEGTGVTLTMTGKVTAVGDVVRQYLSNGVTLAAVGMNGTVSMATSSASPAGNRNLLDTEGSVTGMPGSAAYANWQTLSLGATPANYNGFLKNTATGAKRLTLPLTATGVGGTNADLIRRPVAGEDPTGILYNERLFAKASLRILLSDTAADITAIPGIAAGAPVSLDAWVNPVGYAAAPNATHPPIAQSAGAFSTNITGSVATAPTWTINVGSTANFRPALILSYLGVPTAIACTGKTGTSFTGCAAGVPVTTTGATTFVMGPGMTTTGSGATLTTAATLLNAATVSVASTANFNPAPFWATVGGVSTLVTCTGYTATSFTGCNGNASGTAVSGYMSNTGISTIGGFIKVERQNANSTWTDVTAEILGYGIGAQNLAGTICAEPTTNAVIRLQRLRDNGGVNGGGCNYAADNTGALNPYNWWPNVLFDTREAALRDDPTFNTLTLGGVMYYVSLDVANLAKYFAGAVAPYNVVGGAGSKTDNNGFTVYFSDRRNNRNAASVETGEYGWEDNINPGVANGVPNGTLQAGEDVNGSLALDVYGGVPNYLGTYNTVAACTLPSTCGAVYGVAATTGYVLTTAARPNTTVLARSVQQNRPVLFRRALKLINGGTIAPTVPGLTVVSENPVYVHGNYNDTTGNAAAAHAATAIIADAVTLLSSSWSDNNSFAVPGLYAAGGRLRALNSYYRVAILGGKGINFSRPTDVAASSVFGTDGGAHNFLRMLEQDNGALSTVNYRGSMATLYYSREGNGTFKCCSGTLSDGIVYSVPNRNFSFDTDFLTPALLPPNTPMFRDMNVVGFSQELRPGK